MCEANSATQDHEHALGHVTEEFVGAVGQETESDEICEFHVGRVRLVGALAALSG